MSRLLWTLQDKFASKACRETQWLCLPSRPAPPWGTPGLGVRGGPRSPMLSSHQYWLLQPGLCLGGSRPALVETLVPQRIQRGKDDFLDFIKGKVTVLEKSTPRGLTPIISRLLTAPSVWTRRAVGRQLPHTGSPTVFVPSRLSVHLHSSVTLHWSVCLLHLSVLLVLLTSPAGDACCWLQAEAQGPSARDAPAAWLART